MSSQVTPSASPPKPCLKVSLYTAAQKVHLANLSRISLFGYFLFMVFYFRKLYLFFKIKHFPVVFTMLSFVSLFYVIDVLTTGQVGISGPLRLSLFSKLINSSSALAFCPIACHQVQQNAFPALLGGLIKFTPFRCS